MANTYIDKTTDLNGNEWFINDVVELSNACMTETGKIAQIYAPVFSAVVRIDFGSHMANAYFSDLKLVRRRTADEIPFAAMES